MIADVYPDDAQGIEDPAWVAYGGSQGWACLTKDKKIRRQPAYREASTPIFALSTGNLGVEAMIERFDAGRSRIWRHAQSTRREFWVVYEDGRVERRDPPAGE